MGVLKYLIINMPVYIGSVFFVHVPVYIASKDDYHCEYLLYNTPTLLGDYMREQLHNIAAKMFRGMDIEPTRYQIANLVKTLDWDQEFSTVSESDVPIGEEEPVFIFIRN